MANVIKHKEIVTLKNETKVCVRCIRPDDKNRVSEAFENLEPESVYSRFFHAKKSLTDADLKWATEVDFENVVALVVTIGEGKGEAIIGAGRYIRLEGAANYTSAELAFAVIEAFQRQGIAGMLLRQLTDIARENGLQCFTAEVLARNKGMLAVFSKSGYPMTTRREGDIVHVMLSLQ